MIKNHDKVIWLIIKVMSKLNKVSMIEEIENKRCSLMKDGRKKLDYTTNEIVKVIRGNFFAKNTVIKNATNTD